MRFAWRNLVIIFTILIASRGALAADQPQVNPDLYKGMKWRLVGPFRGGRVLAVSGVPGNPEVFYFGAAAGGVWKTTDRGANWTPLFDDQAVSSIGALAIAPSDPNVIYVGTGESCIRGDISYGDGVYKSLDGGKTWKNVGLRDTRHIGRILVSPKDPNIVFVAALGHAFGPNAERGVFRSTDGGSTWQKVLFKDDHTGAIDLAFAGENPNVIYAALWQATRTPWTLNSGGPGSGIYKSSDGGSTWKQLTGSGLPEGVWGRVGLATSASSSDRIYAIIEGEKGGLYRSENGGSSWKLINGEHRLRQRPWYFDHVFADPKNSDTVFISNVALYRSTDGGVSFKALRGQHGDHHALWIDPEHPERMIDGNDGGAAITNDNGATWTRPANQPTAQFYHVSADNRFNYHIYGAQQDSGTVAIPSRTDTGAIGPNDWYDVGGGESGFVVPYLPDPNIVYADSYDGHITRYDKTTGEMKDVSVWPDNPMGAPASGLKYRFQWTSPLAASPFDPKVMYMGAQMLFRTEDGGEHWTAISGDLTRNDKSKQGNSGGVTIDNTSSEYYDTIFAVAESPKQSGVIWVGTDDGLLQLTRDGGKDWTNVTPSKMPEWGTVEIIEPSPHEPGTAFVAVDRHKMDDFAPYVFKTADFGRSWQIITIGLPATAYVHSVRQDPVDPKLLYAGTENGVFVSFDQGQHWQSLQMNLPQAPVYDLLVKNDDLVAATHGRAFWILDDLAPLRQAPDVHDADVYFYKPRPAYRPSREGGSSNAAVGHNPPGGAVLDYFLSKDIKDPVTLEILDSAGKLVRKYSSTVLTEEKHFYEQEKKFREGYVEHEFKLLPTKKGMNRWTWNLDYEPPIGVPGLAFWGEGPEAPVALPGSYRAVLTVNGKQHTVPIELKMDPRLTVGEAELQSQFELASKINQLVAGGMAAENQILDLRAQLQDLRERIAEQKHEALLPQIGDFEKKMRSVEEKLVETRALAGEDPLQYPLPLMDKLMLLQSTVESSDSAPTPQSIQVFDLLQQGCSVVLKDWEAVLRDDLPKLNEAIERDKIHVLSVGSATSVGQ